jgi:hypothetical protein
MDISKRGEDILFSASDDGYIGVGLGPRQPFQRQLAKKIRRSGTLDRKLLSTLSKPTSP